MYLRLIEALDRGIDALSRELKERASEDDELKLLTTIPGVGYYSALLIKSEIGEIGRFPSGENLCSYAGLVPSNLFLVGRSCKIWLNYEAGFQMAQVDHDRSSHLSRHKE